MEIDEIIEYVSEENSEAAMFQSPDFYDAIVGYVFTEDGLPVLVYDYSKMIESLAVEYEGSEDPTTDAIEWIEYNTLRTLPYIPKEGRPVIMYN